MTDKIILRGDYKPYSHDIPRVELDFELDAARTRVTATLHVERKPSAKTADLVLDADGLAFEKLLVDGRDPGPSGYTLTDTSLTVHKLSAKAVVTVVNTFSPEGNKALSGIYLTRTGNRRDGAK
ncbi:MAG: aminopeptidase N, partial [Duodenibacillus sp.]|nr:aminopeptidase N [Duodenibacillus sp.]